MDYKLTSTKHLLGLILGKRTAARLYTGHLGLLFLPDGEGELAHAKLAAARELVHRWLDEELRHHPVLERPAQVASYLRIHFAGMEREIFAALFLDNRHRLISAENLFLGTVDGASVHPREVVKRALQLNAAAVIVAHNHPSGVAEPSQADEMITHRLKDALALVDIRLLDHLVIGATVATSLAERGLI